MYHKRKIDSAGIFLGVVRIVLSAVFLAFDFSTIAMTA